MKILQIEPNLTTISFDYDDNVSSGFGEAAEATKLDDIRRSRFLIDATLLEKENSLSSINLLFILTKEQRKQGEACAGALLRYVERLQGIYKNGELVGFHCYEFKVYPSSLLKDNMPEDSLARRLAKEALAYTSGKDMRFVTTDEPPSGEQNSEAYFNDYIALFEEFKETIPISFFGMTIAEIVESGFYPQLTDSCGRVVFYCDYERETPEKSICHGIYLCKE